MHTHIISLEYISKIFREPGLKPLVTLERIGFHVHEREIFCLLGPSGSGKSTLLRIMSGLETATSGAVVYDPSIKIGDVSFIFQQFGLLPWLTVAENIGLGLTARNVPEHHKKQRIDYELEAFGLEKFANNYPHELSGGMKQRVGIARALATNPKVLFMDEPFSELDSFTAEELRKELLAIWQERKLTIVIVTHVISEAIELADRIAVLTRLPGRIEKIVENTLGRPRAMRTPEAFALEDELHSLIKG